LSSGISIFYMLKKRQIVIILIIFFTLSCSYKSISQQNFIKRLFTVKYDSTYITSYVTDYTTRLYGSVKYGRLGYKDNLVGASLYYKPNSSFVMGVGGNHGWLGINLGLNFPFVNQDDDKYGETKYLDWTIRVFTPRFNATIYLQHYRGFYLSNTKDMIPGWTEGDPYYMRPDIRTNTAGLEIIYIFNNGRFSYRAAILQNEWQKKSSGSFLVGGSLIYNATIGDSSIVPSKLNYGKFYNDIKFDRSNNFSFGPVAGYAYTFVIKKHYFIMGSINGSVNIGFTRLLPVDSDEKVKSGLAFGIRSEVILSAGYNSDRWYFGLAFVNLSLETQAPIDERSINYETGLYRINLVRRFATKKPIKILNPVF
jgi:hypothetical protein